MGMLENLTKLVFVVPERHTNIFFEKFQEDGVLLLQVDTLVVGPYCEFAVPMCPNVKTIASNGRQWLRSGAGQRECTHKLIEAARDSMKLVHFNVNEWWSVSLVQGRILYASSIMISLTIV